MAVSTYDFIYIGGYGSSGGRNNAAVRKAIIGSDGSLTTVKDVYMGDYTNAVHDIAEHSSGDLMFAYNKNVSRYTKGLGKVTSWGNSGGLTWPGGYGINDRNCISIELDSNDNIYVWDNCGAISERVIKFDSDGNLLAFDTTGSNNAGLSKDPSGNIIHHYEWTGSLGDAVYTVDTATATFGLDTGYCRCYRRGCTNPVFTNGNAYIAHYFYSPPSNLKWKLVYEPYPGAGGETAVDITNAPSIENVNGPYHGMAIDSSGNLLCALGADTNGDPSHRNIFKLDTSGNVLASAEWDTVSGDRHPLVIREGPNGDVWVGGEVDNNDHSLKRYDSDLNLQEEYTVDVLESSAGNYGDLTFLYFYTGPLSYAVYPDDLRHTKKLVAFGNNEVWYESTAGTMTELSEANGELDMTGALQAFEGFQKVFVANNSLKYVADFNNTRLRVTANIDSTTVRDTVLRNSDNAQMVVDYVDNLGGSGMVYGRTITADAFVSGEDVYNTSLGISFAVNSVKEAPLWYEWTPYADDSATYGSLPDKATLGCLWRGRPVLAGNPNYPFQWYMGRVANPWDWAYTANDALTPVAGGNADAGEIGDHVTALIPYNDDYLIFGCLNSVWVMRGDPAYGGQLDIVTLSTGVYGAKAWTWDTDGNLFFFGTGGLYLMPKGFGAVRNLSQNSLPELIDDNTIDPSEYRIVLGYDPRRNGVLLAITKVETGENQNYWYDLRTGGFYPETYSTLNAVYCSHYYESQDDDYRRLLLGCANGYISYFKDTLKNDNAADILGNTYTAIESKMLLPIMPLGDGEDTEGRLTTLTIRTSGGKSSGTFTDTDGMDYEVYVGDSAEEVLEDVEDEATPLVSGTLTGPGRKKRIRNKAKGMNAGIMIKNLNSTETWSIEKVTGVRKPSGRNKR